MKFNISAQFLDNFLVSYHQLVSSNPKHTEPINNSHMERVTAAEHKS